MLLSDSQSQKGHFCITPRDAHVEQHKAEITEKRKIKGRNCRLSFLIHSPYLKYCFGVFELLV